MIHLLEKFEPGDRQHFDVLDTRLMTLPDEALKAGAALIILMDTLVDQPVRAPGPYKGGVRDIRIRH